MDNIVLVIDATVISSIVGVTLLYSADRVTVVT